MLALTNMLHFFAYEFARLGRRGFAFAFVFPRPLDCFFFWHNKRVSLQNAELDVTTSAPQIYICRPNPVRAC